mgnify:CR=1 FL=1
MSIPGESSPGMLAGIGAALPGTLPGDVRCGGRLKTEDTPAGKVLSHRHKADDGSAVGPGRAQPEGEADFEKSV